MKTRWRSRLGVAALYAALMIGVGARTDATPLRVLMIGNSYTQGNATARATYVDLQGLLDADAAYDATVVNESFGGATLFSHASPGSDAVAELIGSAGEYDVVVLQERSDRPGRAMKFGGTQLNRLNDGAPVLIDDVVRVFQPQAEVVLFNTWARHPDLEPAGEDDLATYFNDDPVEMQTLTTQGYGHVLTGSTQGDLSDITRIAPVGPAWQAWYEAFGYQNPSLGLHDTDGSHQNDLGAYLSAAVLYETITGTSSVGNAYAGAVTGSLGPWSLTTALQRRATATVGSDLLPGDYNADGTVNAADYAVWRDGVGYGSTPQEYWTWSANLRAQSGGSAPIPESGSAVLLVFALGIYGINMSEARIRHR